MSTRIRCASFSPDESLRRHTGYDHSVALGLLSLHLLQIPCRTLRSQLGASSPVDRGGRSAFMSLTPDRTGSGGGHGGTEAPAPNAAPESATATKLRVLLADDHMLLRQGLAQMLGNQPDMLVVAQANDGMEALELAHKLQPDVVLMDITMPNLSGIDATRRMAKELPGVKVIGLSMHDSEELITAMKEAGAAGFINKADAMDKLLTLLRGE